MELNQQDNYKKKLCWACKSELVFSEICESNLNFTEEAIRILWQNPFIEFYCCKCFNDEKRLIEIKKQQKKIKNKLENIKKDVEKAKKHLDPKEIRLLK